MTILPNIFLSALSPPTLNLKGANGTARVYVRKKGAYIASLALGFP